MNFCLSLPVDYIREAPRQSARARFGPANRARSVIPCSSTDHIGVTQTRAAESV